MGINPHDFRAFVIEPACDLLERLAKVPNPPYARDLLMATAAQESRLGVYLHQTGAGPAVGVFQIEPASLTDLLGNFATGPRFAPALTAAGLLPTPAPEDQIITNLFLAAVVCRLFYYRVPAPLPPQTTLDTLWMYYKPHYNTDAGAATREQFEASLKLTDIAL